jgi:hypothetical protein
MYRIAIGIFPSVKHGNSGSLKTVSRLFWMNDKFDRRFADSMGRNDSSTENRYSSGRYINGTPRAIHQDGDSSRGGCGEHSGTE